MQAKTCLILLLLFIGFGVEVRADGDQIVLRWGGEPAARPLPVTPAPNIDQARFAQQTREELELMRKLVHELAAVLDGSDRDQLFLVADLERRLDQLSDVSDQQWRRLHSDVAALYQARFGNRSSGEEE